MCALIKLLFTEHEEPSRRGSRLSISLFLHLWSRLPYMQRGEKLLCCYLHRRYLHSDFEKVHSADENSLFFHLFAFSFFALRDFSPTSLSFFLLVCFTFPPPRRRNRAFRRRWEGVFELTADSSSLALRAVFHHFCGSLNARSTSASFITAVGWNCVPNIKHKET